MIFIAMIFIMSGRIMDSRTFKAGRCGGGPLRLFHEKNDQWAEQSFISTKKSLTFSAGRCRSAP
jgi:hypothetical protein